MIGEVLNEMRDKTKQATQAFTRSLATVRAGRANPNILDNIYVEYYGTQTPLNQLANVGAPEARLLTITPYDKSALPNIEKAIQKADLGLTPSSDGDIIRINIPSLTEERRKELVRVVGKYTEEARIQIRNHRRDANDQLRKAEKDGDLTEDELHNSEEKIQSETNRSIDHVEQLAKQKEEEILEV